MSRNRKQADDWGLHVDYDDAWVGLYYNSLDELHTIPSDQLDAIALEGLQARFVQLRDKLPILRKLADEQDVFVIDDINDAAKLLFQHSVYKSYPLSFIEKNQFDRLTKWLGGLTTVDLSGVDASQIESIDDWIALLDVETQIRIVHSSGTSGKLSFLPRSTLETDLMVQNWRLLHEGGFSHLGADAPGLDEIPIIFPTYRTGAMAQNRMMNRIVDTVFGGDQSMLITLNDGRMSADALSIGGRLQASAQKGELGEVRLSPTLIARRDELVRNMTEAPRRLAAFFDSLATSLAGRQVGMLAMMSHLLDIALAGREKGMSHIFAPDNNIIMGGGWKGRTPPENWRQILTEFLGVEELRDGYGMSELLAVTRACKAGHYHLFPMHIPFLLDPLSGAPFPRDGERTGRFGVFDLGATTYWGGFLTGDKVTLSYNSCACGRSTPAIQAGSVSRYSEAEGGDDKITCAGAPEAHDNALAYLMASVEN